MVIFRAFFLLFISYCWWSFLWQTSIIPIQPSLTSLVGPIHVFSYFYIFVYGPTHATYGQLRESGLESMNKLFLDLLHEPKSCMLSSELGTLATSRAHENGLVSKNWATLQGAEGAGWQPHVIIDEIEKGKKEETPIRPITPLVFSASRVISKQLKCTKINQPIFPDNHALTSTWLYWRKWERGNPGPLLHYYLVPCELSANRPNTSNVPK